MPPSLTILIADVAVIAEAKNGKEAVQLATQQQPDLLLLDIRMPLMDGLEAAQHMQKLMPRPQIIFTTAYDAYAIKAFDLNAIDYLLKPIRLERLQAAIEKAKAISTPALQALKPLQKTRSHLSIHERGSIVLIPIEDIIYCRAELKYITLRTQQKAYLLEAEFGEVFIRLHRNCLVTQRHISGYEKRKDDSHRLQWHAILKGVTETIKVSRRQQHLIRKP
ncbi:MAG: response regulator transcription factor [Methylophilaceae bacterium]|nr:MAG: response regulator transcription factor [Methylophilaceae bacterium]